MNKIQRKFLVSADIQRWLKKQILRLQKIEQFYIRSDRGTLCYYLKYFPNTHTKVITDKEGKETRCTVTEEEYTVQRQNHRGRKIVKKSYTVTIEEETFVFFQYMKKLQGLYVLVAYFEDADAMRDSETLQTLHAFILKEMDNDKKYYDRSLALYAKPMEYNLEKLFEKIDVFEPANLFFWQVPSRLYVRDGIALILYKNLRLIAYYKESYQAKHFSATLHRLRVLLRRSATILETFSELFDPQVQRSCCRLLLHYYEETKRLRYLYFFEDLSHTRTDMNLTLFSALKSLTAQEEQSVTKILSSDDFSDLIQTLRSALGTTEYAPYHALKKEVKKVVKKRLRRLETMLAQTKEGYDEEMLEQLYNSLDALQTHMEDFFHVIGQKKTQMILDELNILFKPLREYRNCKEREMILHQMKEYSGNPTLEIDPLLCEHREVLKEKIDNALRLLRTSKFYI